MRIARALGTTVSVRDSLAGTPALTTLARRQDRWWMPAWILALVATATVSAAATKGLYPDEASRITASRVINATPSLVALYGRVYDPTSLGSLALIKLTAFGAALVGVLMAATVIRHTRSEEADGRLELLEAGIVGRSAPLAAALIFAWGASLILGACTALGLVLAGLPVTGAVAFGASWAAAGVLFASLAGVSAQLTAAARPAIGLSLAAIAVAYVLRAFGDIGANGPSWSTWLSPIGWAQQVRPFAGNRFVVLLIPLAASGVIAAGAFVLRAHRDLGAGMIPDRPGPATGKLDGPWRLALRVDRWVIVAWLCSTMVFGVLVGSLTSEVGDLIDSPAFSDYFHALGGAKALNDAFLSAELALFGVIAAAFGIATIRHLSSDEAAGRAELVLAAMKDRRRWVAARVCLALSGTTGLLIVAGFAVGVGHAIDTGSLSDVGSLVLAGLARAPAACVASAVALVLFGWVPRWAGAAWGVYGAFLLVEQLGAFWRLPRFVVDLSPFVHSPKLPGAAPVAVPTLVLCMITALMVAVGFVGTERRDLHA